MTYQDHDTTTAPMPATVPTCDICRRDPAAYDGKTITGPWAYMCPPCFAAVGIGVGLGRGQRLI